jgi:archaellum component FlaD/FlaE
MHATALPMGAPSDASAVRLWAARPGFGSSMLLLSWADMLLKNAPTRESYAQLLEYYHNIGWIGDVARDQLHAYADGLAHKENAEAAKDWRASLDVHEKSLLFLEKLRAIAEGRGSD